MVKDVSSLTSKALQIDISDKSIVPNIEIPNDQVVTTANTYRPVTSANDPEGMFYVTMNVPNDNDVVLFYLKPLDFDPSTHQVPNLYRLYLQEETFPTSSNYIVQYSYSVRDWIADLGFKVMLPSTTSGISLKKAKYYVGIKVVPGGYSVYAFSLRFSFYFLYT